ARSFPCDASRYFDIVVTNCDKSVVDDITRYQYAPGYIIRGDNKPFDVPSLAERRQDIETATRLWGGYSGLSIVPLLSSTGCPYDCDFCIDWDNPYRLRNARDLTADLDYASAKMQGRTLAFYDPNFGVNFEKTLAAIEMVPKERRNPYIMESSLSILKAQKLARLKETNCIFVAPGI